MTILEATVNRRAFLRGMCLGGIATFATPLATFARVPGDGKLVFILLRGGFDGLAAVVPIGDSGYAAIRGAMAFGASDLVSLEAEFALAPGLAPLQTFWDAGELVPLHAMAIPFRTRSHFDGQAVLETGLGKPSGESDGWLNRLLQVMGGNRTGIAIAAGLPRSLSGPYPVLSWSPTELGAVEDAYLDRLHFLYQRDADLHNRFEAALQLRDLSGETGMEETDGGAGGAGAANGGGAASGSQNRMSGILHAATRFLREPDGPNVAALEFSGWDTHSNQGLAGGPLDRLLGQLAQGLVDFRESMGSAWADTTVVVMTEFGRTARPNGTGGSDHGTAGAGFVIGPRVGRSRVLADWPGLGERELYEDRDLRPTLDTRAVLKGVVEGVFDLTSTQSARVFPGSESIASVHTLTS